MSKLKKRPILAKILYYAGVDVEKIVEIVEILSNATIRFRLQGESEIQEAINNGDGTWTWENIL